MENLEKVLNDDLGENCLNCAIGLALKLGAIFGLPFFSIKCQHSKMELKSKITYSKCYLFTGLATFAWLFYATVNAVYQLKNVVFSLDKLFDLLFIIPHFVIYCCSTVTILYAIVRVKIIEDAYKSFQLTMEIWRKLTFKVLLTTKDIKSLRFRTFLYIGLIGIVLVISIMVLFMYDIESKMDGLERGGRILTFYVIVVVIFILTVIDDYFKLVCKKFHLYLKADLESKFSYSADKFPPEKNLLFYEKFIFSRKDLIATYTQLHARLIHSFNFMNQFLNPLVLIWILGFTIAITVNTFLILMAFLENFMNVFHATMINIEFEVVGSLALIFFTAIRNSAMQAVPIMYCILALVCWAGGTYFFINNSNSWTSEKIVSYLYKYSIDKLNTTSANQLEFLIATLNAQKATLNCLDIVSVGLPLIASVSGTVITYVIIALQFQVIFTRKVLLAHRNITVDIISNN